MTLQDGWQALFAPHILLRGKDYWRQGRVETLQCTPEYVRAAVCGSEDYEVEIFLENGAVMEQYCSCPYAADGTACKHMAAVLFALAGGEDAVESSDRAEEEDLDAPDDTDAEAVSGWQETLRALSQAQAKEFLEELLVGDRALQRLLVLTYGQEAAEDQLEACWQAQLEQIVSHARSGKPYIDYAHADDFYTALNRFAEDRLPGLLRKEALEAAFHLICMVFTTAMDEEADSSDGGMTLLAGTCTDGWKAILSRASDAQRSSFRDWFAAQVIERSNCFGMEEIEALLFGFDWDARELQKNLALLDELLTRETLPDYWAKVLLERKERAMRALGRPEAEIDALWDENLAQPCARDRKLDRLLAKQDYGAAIAQLQAEQTLSAGDPWRQRKCSEKRIELYRLTGQEDAYRQELLLHLETWPQRDLDFVHELRAVTPEDAWQEIFERLLRLPTMQALRFDLLKDEGQWARLFEALDRQNELYLLERYIRPLANWNLERTLALFSRLCDREMARASSREAYRSVLQRAAAIRKYPGGDALFARLLESWQAQYPRKSALLDEIRRLH